MYQSFQRSNTQLVAKLISQAPDSNLLEQPLANLIHFITLNMFKNISNRLFFKHQLMFVFLIAVRIGLENGG
jgi:dynein heavy chain